MISLEAVYNKTRGARDLHNYIYILIIMTHMYIIISRVNNFYIRFSVQITKLMDSVQNEFGYTPSHSDKTRIFLKKNK